jgi:hypothetical protein
MVRQVKRTKSMSTLEKDGLEACLFSRQDHKLVNIKFMRGHAEIIEPKDFRSEICKVVTRRDGGQKPSEPVKSGKNPTNIRQLVTGM